MRSGTFRRVLVSCPLWRSISGRAVSTASSFDAAGQEASWLAVSVSRSGTGFRRGVVERERRARAGEETYPVTTTARFRTIPQQDELQQVARDLRFHPS